MMTCSEVFHINIYIIINKSDWNVQRLVGEYYNNNPTTKALKYLYIYIYNRYLRHSLNYIEIYRS
jgi:sulfur relay (sulfurtransferase) DsrC/TusE family protein